MTVEDTEWTDVLRAHGIIPDRVIEALDEMLPEKPQDTHSESSLDSDPDEWELAYLESRKAQYGQIQEINNADFVAKVTEDSRRFPVVLLLYHESTASAELLETFQKLAAQTSGLTFLKIVGSECIPNYPARHCPTVLIYKNAEMKAQIVGVEKCKQEKKLDENVALEIIQRIIK
jgi:thioredoxin-like negative regulator of GroEL